MNQSLSKLCAEFEKMEKTIAYQQKIINAAMQKTPVCPCGYAPVTVPDPPKLKLDDLIWQEIAMYAQSGMADKVFELGDTKEITLTNGSTIHVRIIGFNHDLNDIGQTNPITFESVETLDEDYPMNEQTTNEGGWKDSFLRAKLNGDFLQSVLPDDLREVIKPTSKLTSIGGAKQQMGKTTDQIFVLSEQEIFGRKVFSIGGEGRWYEWYRQEDTPYHKCKQNGEKDYWWERSPYGSHTTGFCYVGSSGAADNYNASSSYGVSFGFCV